MRDLDGHAAQNAESSDTRTPAYCYHLLRAALGAGLSGLDGWDEAQAPWIAEKARKSFDLETLVIACPEAADVVIPDTRLDRALSEVRARYADRQEFLADLARNGLDEEILRLALHRELIFDAVMQRVAARRPAIGKLDERLFFELHRERFNIPERRTARHILITVNENFAANRRDAARARIEVLADKLAGRASRFPSQARKHSECPSAMEGGRLGTVPRGHLYETLDEALFALPEGAISRPVESELGFHLLWCEKIHPARSLSFAEARQRIRRLLEARAGRSCQKAWIAELQRGR